MKSKVLGRIQTLFKYDLSFERKIGCFYTNILLFSDGTATEYWDDQSSQNSSQYFCEQPYYCWWEVLSTIRCIKQSCSLQPRQRDVVTNNGHFKGLLWHSADGRTADILLDIICFVSPSNCNYGSQCGAQFPEGIIIKHVQIISPDLECSNKVAQYNSGGNGPSKKPVFADQGTESDEQWHLYSSFDCMAESNDLWWIYCRTWNLITAQDAGP